MDMTPVWLSIKTSIIAVGIVLVVGSTLAVGMHRTRFPGKPIIESAVMLPLVLPPFVAGFILLLLLGKHGPVGRLLGFLGLQVIFSWWAVVISASVVALPLMYQSIKTALESVDPMLEQAARTLGAGEFKVLRTVTLPLAWPGFVSGTVMAFTRALGEFGATLMIAGNIPGQTQTIPIAIYSSSQSGDFVMASYLVLVLMSISFSMIIGVKVWRKKSIPWV